MNKQSHALIAFVVASFAFALPAAGLTKDFKYSEKNLKGAYTFRLVPAVSLAPLNTGPAKARQDILRVGVFVADGNGKIRGRMVVTSDDLGGNTMVKDLIFTGTYSIDVDGFGTMIIAPLVAVADEGNESYAIKLNDRTKSAHLIETDNVSGGAKIFLSGDAVIDRPIGTEDFQ